MTQSLAGCSISNKPVDHAEPSDALPVVPAVPRERPPSQPILDPSDSLSDSTNTGDSSTSNSDTNPSPWSQHRLMKPQKTAQRKLSKTLKKPKPRGSASVLKKPKPSKKSQMVLEQFLTHAGSQDFQKSD